jgi:hypothetical protein
MTFMDIHNPIFDFLVKHTYHTNEDTNSHTTPLRYPTEEHNPSQERHVTRYCIPTKHKRLGSPQQNRVLERHEGNM